MKEKLLFVEVSGMQINPANIKDIQQHLVQAQAKGMNYVSFPKDTLVLQKDLATFPNAFQALESKYFRPQLTQQYVFEPIAKILTQIQKLPPFEKRRNRGRSYGQ